MSNSILILDGDTLDHATFQELCLKPNRPTLIRNASSKFLVHRKFQHWHGNATDDERPLESMKEWFSPAGLERIFGAASQKMIPAYRSVDVLPGEDPPDFPIAMETLSLQQVYDAWSLAAQRDSPFHHRHRCYIMNWHFQQEAEASLLSTDKDAVKGKGDQPAMYALPAFLGLDLMHGYHLACGDEKGSGGSGTQAFGDGISDYRFVYMGMEQTWTPFHHDVFGTFSWSLNVVGRKLWYFFSPESQEWAETHFLPGHPRPPDMRTMAWVELHSFVQEPGDLVFVPSCWFHQVHNIVGEPATLFSETTREKEEVRLVISVNHNWMSFEQLPRMVRCFHDDALAMVGMVDEASRKAFTDEEWFELVEKMLLTGSSWNMAVLKGLVKFAKSVLERRATHHKVLDAGPNQWTAAGFIDNADILTFGERSDEALFLLRAEGMLDSVRAKIFD